MKGSSTKLIDFNLLKVSCAGSVELFNQMINLFLATTPELINVMKTNINDKNWDALNLNAHKVKSSFSVIGAVSTASKIEQIEFVASESDRNRLENLMVDVENESNFIFNELRNRLLRT